MAAQRTAVAVRTPSPNSRPVVAALHDQAGRRRRALRELLVRRARTSLLTATTLVPRWSSWVRAHRAAVTCAGWILLIALATLLLAVLTWRGMVEQRLAARDGAGEGRDLTASLSTRGRARADGGLSAPSRTSTSGGGMAAPAPDQTSSSPDQVLLSGPVPAAGSALLVLVGGVGGGRFVLRRYRRTPEVEGAAADEASGDVPELPDGELPGAPAGPDQELATPGEAECSAPSDDAPIVLPAEVPGTGVLVAPLSGVSDETSSAARLLPAAAALDGGRTSLLLSRPGGLASASLDARVISAGREVIYERRALPRITYVAPGVLECNDLRCSVTVLDLSESGLRCEVSAQEATAAKPGNTAYVRISFALPSGWLDLKAQVAWNRRADGGMQFGLQFLQPSEQATAQLREACLAGVAV